MAFSVYPYYIDANYSSVYLYDDADKITTDFMNAFPELDGVGGMNAANIKTNLIQKIAAKFVPSYFIQIALNYYKNTKNIDDLPATDDATKLNLAAFNPDANPCKLTIASDGANLNELEAAQLEYIFALTDRLMNFFLFEFSFDDDPITYGSVENQILGNLAILNLGSAFSLIQLPNPEIANFKDRLAGYLNFSNIKAVVFGNETHLNLFSSGIDQGTWYTIQGKEGIDKYNIKNIATPKNKGDTNKGILLSRWLDGTVKKYDDLLAIATAIKLSPNLNPEEIAGLSLKSVNMGALIKSIPANLANKTPYYWVDQAGTLAAILGRFIPNIGGGGVGGRGRADNVDENVSIWSGNQFIAYAIGLPIETKDQSAIISSGADRVFKTNTPSATYEPDALLSKSEDAKIYGIIKNKTVPNIKKSLNKFPPIFYFKRFKGADAKRKNKPLAGYDPPRVFESPIKNFKYIGKQLLTKKKMKGGEAAKVTPGVKLSHKQSMERENAGTVMGKFLYNKKFKKDQSGDVLKTGYDAYFAQNNPGNSGSSLPATDFTDYLAQKDQILKTKILDLYKDATPYFKNLVVPKGGAQALRVITDQEWCHLYGHGDGGPDIPENFVSGSKHCNTEQLAIETGQRKRKIDGLTAKITAYLLPAQTVWYTGAASDDGPLNRGDVKMPLADLKEFPLPTAHMMRYKVYHGGKKVFDHWYDAQSQSFDYYEFLILEEFVDWKVSLLDPLAKYEYNTSLISRFLERLFRDCAKLDPPIDCSSADFTPFKAFPAGYKDAKQKKKKDPKAVAAYVVEGAGKGIYDKFKFDDESGIILGDEIQNQIPQPIKTTFAQLIKKLQA
ncbi:hypothetical protein LEP1GSC058_0061 [Leptospira fainei serovar Hurstbridge str. BUT 6]|uniref:Uncharacterized protein n=1 Tax=Leptospira fainei serovar Hurstbridge str. BUT 6 TaxID=1193011 RepID=S3UXL7_9LEPT|nr:hypothetical protein [Leptospira fainei]EPG75131.1 hypothetical protein LEP1GSC058_0061 [Leptospira fainei serovar Hurstbridge str. BUT 6]